jgi:hypothetical protein
MEACTFEADQFNRQQPKASRDWLAGIIEIIWKHTLDVWASQNQDQHGTDADKEVQAKRPLLPRARGLCERHSHLPHQATETMLDVDLATRETQTARKIQQWLQIAEPHLKQQEKAVKEQEKQRKKHPTATHQDLREHFSVAPKSPTRRPIETRTAEPKTLKQSLLPTEGATTHRRTTTHTPNITPTNRAKPKTLK